MPGSYEDRPYLKDAKTGEHLSTEVMYYGDERIVGHKEVLERLLILMPRKAAELGGKNLVSRHFIDAFQIRGPSYGDVVRQTLDKLVTGKKFTKRNVGTPQHPRYAYDLK